MSFLDTLKNIGGKLINNPIVGFNTYGGYKPPASNTQSNTSPQGFQYTPMPQPKVDTKVQNWTKQQQANSPVSIQNLTTPRIDTSPVADSSLNSTEYITPTTTMTDMSGFDSYFTETDTKPKDSKNEMLTFYQDLLKEQGTQADFTEKAQKEVQLEERRQELADINARALTRKRQLEKEIETIRTDPGKTKAFVNQEISEKTRKANQELADLAIQQSVALGNVDTALQIVQDKVSAKFDPIAQQLTGVKDFMTLYNDDLTSSEKILLQSQISQQESQLEAQMEEEKLQGQASVYQNMLSNGTITPDKIPQEVLSYINTSGYVSPEQKTALITNKNNAKKAFDILNDPLLTSATGKLRGIDVSGARESVRQDIVSLMSGLTLDNLSKLKGAPSDRDIEVVQSATSKIGNPENLKKLNGNEIVKELNDVLDVFVNSIVESGASTLEDKVRARTYQIKLDPMSKGMTDKDIADLILEELSPQASFNSAGNASASTIANAIKKVESSGNYNAKGGSGEFGAYQFMPNTWKQWAGEFLGNPNAQPTPQNQDKVANAKITQLLNQGYNPEQIALIWNGGTPTRKKGVNKFGVKYDSGAYADKVLSQLT